MVAAASCCGPQFSAPVRFYNKSQHLEKAEGLIQAQKKRELQIAKEYYKGREKEAIRCTYSFGVPLLLNYLV
jgi:hypothetical protein